tara:strand:- start:1763 stop:4330 length:2568 start_codon:yes stop_codon:yes gene_type:complete
MRAKSRITPGKGAGKISSPIRVSMDSLIQGVSQQPPHLRLVGQAEEQINGWSSPVEGLAKRNPMRMVARIKDIGLSNFYLEMLDVSATESYSILLYPIGDKTRLEIFRNGVPPALNVHGAGMTLSNGGIDIDSTGYLHNLTDLYKGYVLINNGPTGILLNRNKTTALSETLSPTRENNGLVFIQGVAYDITYTVKIDEVEVASYTTPSASDDDNKLSTSKVAENLASQINAIAGYTAIQNSYVVEVRKDDDTAFNIEVDDDRSNSLARGFTDKVTSLSELPTIAPNGYIVNVAEDPSTDIDDRYFKFTTNDEVDFGEGGWGETVKPGIPFKFNVDTMPLVIRRQAEGVLFIGPADAAEETEGDETFTFPKWAERTAGDTTTVPDPEFIGQPIKDHILFRSRYIVCAGTSVVFSEVDDIFNFFQDTSSALTDTDPFSLRATSERSSQLNWLLPVDESILVFSAYSQFQARPADADVLTPTTAIILRLSNLESNPDIRPKLAGPQVLFGTREFGYTHFREYTFFESTQRKIGLNLGGSNDVTLNLPKYIDGFVTHWDVGETVDTAVAITAKDRKTMYVYKYLWGSAQSGLSKQQASFSKWVFKQDVQWVKFMDNVLWLILTDEGGTYSCQIASDELETPDALQLHLDRLLLYPECNSDPQSSNDVTATYDAVTDTTTFVLPYTPTDKAVAVTRFTGASKEGLWLGDSESNTIVCNEKGDWTNEKIGFGEPYEFKYTFSNGYLPTKDQSKQKIIGELDGRTQVLRWHVYHYQTGAYNVRVKRKARERDSVHHFRARFLNTFNNKLDTEESFVESGTLQVPVCSKNTDCVVSVESDSWLPCVLSGAAWEGSYNDRAKGV